MGGCGPGISRSKEEVEARTEVERGGRGGGDERQRLHLKYKNVD